MITVNLAKQSINTIWTMQSIGYTNTYEQTSEFESGAIIHLKSMNNKHIFAHRILIFGKNASAFELSKHFFLLNICTLNNLEQFKFWYDSKHETFWFQFVTFSFFNWFVHSFNISTCNCFICVLFKNVN